MKNMYTLSYESLEAYELSSDELKLLHETAHRKNKKMNISGCLAYYHGRFIQILEGEREDIIDLYDKIKDDERHNDVHLFSEDGISEKAFPEWGMAYFPMDRNLIGETEREDFDKKLSLLSNLMHFDNVTARLFWKRIKFHVKYS